MDQGFIAAFKAIFLRLTFEYLLNKMDNDANLTVIEIWKTYSMDICLNFIDMSLKELRLKPSTLAGCWKKICPIEGDTAITAEEIVNSSEEVNRVVALSHALGGEGFSDLADSDIRELISDDVELSEEDLSDIVDECYDEEFLDDEFLEDGIKEGFAPEILSEILQLASRLKNIVFEHDFNVERSVKFQRELDNVLTPFAELRKEMDRLLPEQFPAIDFIDENDNELIQIQIEKLDVSMDIETKEQSN